MSLSSPIHSKFHTKLHMIARICHSPFSVIYLKFIILPDIPNYNKINIKSQNCKICQIAYYYYNNIKYIIIFPRQKRDSLRIVYCGNCGNPQIKTHSIYGLCLFNFLIKLIFFSKACIKCMLGWKKYRLRRFLFRLINS